MKSKQSVLISLLLLSGCAMPKPIIRIDTSHIGVNLHIPDVAWDPKKADLEAGWCGEACIQMALAYYGKQVPQDIIHREGHPRTSDLEDEDMDRALRNSGLLFRRYSGKPNGLQSFLTWIQKQVRSGYPVICGCKIYPTDHPDWDLDHFVLVTGYNSKGLLLNTQLNCDGQLLVPYDQLKSLKPGYSFKNPGNQYWGRVVTGIR